MYAHAHQEEAVPLVCTSPQPQSPASPTQTLLKSLYIVAAFTLEWGDPERYGDLPGVTQQTRAGAKPQDGDTHPLDHTHIGEVLSSV